MIPIQDINNYDKAIMLYNGTDTKFNILQNVCDEKIETKNSSFMANSTDSRWLYRP